MKYAIIKVINGNYFYAEVDQNNVKIGHEKYIV